MFISEEKLKELREEYPTGIKIVLIYMDDIQAPKPGTHGTVINVDDAGHIHVKWECRSSLALIPGIDKFKKY